MQRFQFLLIPTSEYGKSIEERWLVRTNFAAILKQLRTLSPLSHPNPFLILGYTDQYSTIETQVFEIESNPNANNGNTIWNHEFEHIPPEFYQLGVDILSFFGTYLREQYPEKNATVTVKQKKTHGTYDD